ncbi:hypothetical protein Pcinc_027530 [Petrolisthes cinctipes]|uniref:C2H2-type domain-containing protein n=1 Tax=Petrolisthes cinctipes TaxID=88211 RepID=A0AAE1F5U5_PETCI|nr:hypothetical protein Pcinc_027530 [Petrolisthes cinctipes]
MATFSGSFPWPPPPASHQAGGAGAPTPDNQCVFCFKSFSNRGSMTRHLRDQHLQPGATVTCDICGKVCKNRNCLITHRSVAHAGRRRLRGVMLPSTVPWPPQDKDMLPPLPPLHLPPHHQVPTDQYKVVGEVLLPLPLLIHTGLIRSTHAQAPPRTPLPHAVSLAGSGSVGGVGAGLVGGPGAGVFVDVGGGGGSGGCTEEMWYPRVVLRPKTYLCPFCDKCFTNRQSRSRHVHQKHAAGLAGTCTVCGHVYTNLQTRCAHTRVHSRKIKP